MKTGGYKQALFAQSATQLEPLGRIRVVKDRVFVYAKAGATALAAGAITIGPAPVTGHNGMVCAAAAIGKTEITVTPTSNNVTANQYKDGMLWFDTAAGTGYGQGYKVNSNPAITASSSGIILLDEPLRVAITASTTAALYPNLQAGVVVLPGATAAATAALAGVPPMAVTAGNYFWNQVKGPAPVLVHGTVVLGNAVYADWTNSSGVAGACIPASTLAMQIIGDSIGLVLTVIGTTGYALVNLGIKGY